MVYNDENISVDENIDDWIWWEFWWKYEYQWKFWLKYIYKKNTKLMKKNIYESKSL